MIVGNERAGAPAGVRALAGAPPAGSSSDSEPSPTRYGARAGAAAVVGDRVVVDPDPLATGAAPLSGGRPAPRAAS